MQINREKNVETFILCRKKNPAFVHNYRKSDKSVQKVESLKKIVKPP